MDNIFHKMKLNKCNLATTTTGKADLEDEQLFDPQEHQQLRRLVGKLQWLAYTRPDISYATKELARALQQPTIKDQKKLRHLVKYLAHKTTNSASDQQSNCMTRHHNNSTGQDVVRQDESTTGFVIELLGTCIHFGSRTQGVVALSSAEPAFYAIGTGAQEALYIRGFIMKALNT